MIGNFEYGLMVGSINGVIFFLMLEIFYLRDKAIILHFEQTLTDNKVEQLASATGFDQCRSR